MKSIPLWRRQDFIIKRAIRTGIENSLPFIKGRVLDVGCGNKPYEELIVKYATEYIGVDIPTEQSANKEIKKADIFSDISTGLPFKDNTFDTVICTEVLEHLPNPWHFMNECARIMKKDSHLILTTPQTWELHEEPHDFFRFTRYGLQSLIKDAGFQAISIHAHCGTIASLAQLIVVQITNSFIIRKPKWLRAFWSVINIIILQVGLFLDRIFPSNKLPLGNTLIAKKK
ncbi:MAG: class I SAM-dependent methyltransferase [Nitrososphaerota archaeon]